MVLQLQDAYATTEDLALWLGLDEAPPGSDTALMAARRLFDSMPQLQPIGGRLASNIRSVASDAPKDDDGEYVVDPNDKPYGRFYDTLSYDGGQPLIIRYEYNERDVPDPIPETADDIEPDNVVHVLDPLREASCAQVEYWWVIGNGVLEGSQDVLRPRMPATIGTISIPAYPVIAPRAVQTFIAKGRWRPQLRVTGDYGYRYWDF